MMAILIIGVLAISILSWAIMMSRSSRSHEWNARAVKPRMGRVRLFRFGAPIIQTPEQKTEWLLQNRERYDPSLDRLDPRNRNFASPQEGD